MTPVDLQQRHLLPEEIKIVYVDFKKAFGDLLLVSYLMI
jgi:hypothetical protein